MSSAYSNFKCIIGLQVMNMRSFSGINELISNATPTKYKWATGNTLILYMNSLKVILNFQN